MKLHLDKRMAKGRNFLAKIVKNNVKFHIKYTKEVKWKLN